MALMSPAINHPNGRRCVIKNAAGQQIARVEVPGLGPAAITAAREAADAQATAAGYHGQRHYVETKVVLP
jgi:DUF1009 family protein